MNREEMYQPVNKCTCWKAAPVWLCLGDFAVGRRIGSRKLGKGGLWDAGLTAAEGPHQGASKMFPLGWDGQSAVTGHVATPLTILKAAIHVR
jgi:hypothetical protein